MEGKTEAHKRIALTASIIFVLIALVADGPATYRFAPFFLIPLLWAVYFSRIIFCIAPVHFAVLAAAFLMHNLGAFGAYRQNFLGFDFDTYVHYFFGFAGGLIVARALSCNLRLGGWKLWTGTILLILGIGAVHELIEFLSTLILGPEKGMLKINSPDKFDTHKDLANNLFGTLTALLGGQLVSRPGVSKQS